MIRLWNRWPGEKIVFGRRRPGRKVSIRNDISPEPCFYYPGARKINCDIFPLIVCFDRTAFNNPEAE